MTSASNQQHFDIIIVGGGLVGATLARALADTALTLAMVDRQFPAATETEAIAAKNAAAPQFDARVSAITGASKQLFARLGVWQGIIDRRCQPYQQMKVWDAEGTGSISFSAKDIHCDELGSIVENRVILESLYQQLRSQSNLEFQAPTSLLSLQKMQVNGAQRIQLELENGIHITTSLLIAADGANSKIRELAMFDTREWDYQHHAIVTTVRTAAPHENTAWQRFMPTGPLAFLPLPGYEQHYCSIVWSALPELASELMTLNEVDFNQALEKAFEQRLGTIESSAPRFSFPLRQRHAKCYVQDNIALVGDAAHTIHPLAGQGVNLGLKDVEVLAEEIQAALKKGLAHADNYVLNRYQRRRMSDNKSMMWMMEGFQHLFGSEELPLRWLRNHGMSAIDQIPLIKNQLARQAMGVDQ